MKPNFAFPLARAFYQESPVRTLLGKISANRKRKNLRRTIASSGIDKALHSRDTTLRQTDDLLNTQIIASKGNSMFPISNEMYSEVVVSHTK